MVIGLGQYLAFVGVSLLVICTPGQDTALTIRNTLLGDRRTGAATALGVSAGQATWTVATSAGLAVILTASAPLFLAIRLAGAAYLVYLGGRSLLSAIVKRDPRRAPARPAPRLSTRTAFLQGFLSNLSNAKMVAFFVSLLPPFAGPHPSLGLLLALGFQLLPADAGLAGRLRVRSRAHEPLATQVIRPENPRWRHGRRAGCPRSARERRGARVYLIGAGICPACGEFRRSRAMGLGRGITTLACGSKMPTLASNSAVFTGGAGGCLGQSN